MPLCRSRGPRLAGALFGLAILLTPPPAAAADGQAFLALRDMMRSWVREHAVPAASAAMMSRGESVRMLRYGGLRATDPARIASLSKAITAVCIARLIDDRRLSFGATAGAVLAPVFQRAGMPADPRFRTVTIEQLLTHRAGLAREAARRPKSGDMLTAFKAAIATPLDNAPGGGFSYSNVGYVTLGMIVEAVSGEGYEEHCRRRVLAPLGASGSIDPELRHRMPNGGWRLSAVDYLKFMQVWEPGSNVLGPASRQWLDSQGGKAAYGLGIRIQRNARGVRYSHGGRVAHRDRGGSYAVKFEDGLTVVVLYEGNLDKRGRQSLPKLVNATFALR